MTDTMGSKGAYVLVDGNTSSTVMRRMLPRTHAVRIEGWMRSDGILMWLESDPSRPSAVYRRRLGHGTVSSG